MIRKPIKAFNVSWTYHPDPLVDLATIGFVLPISEGFEELYLPSHEIATESDFSPRGIGEGSPSYVVGLFRYLHGQQRNLPMVHAGHIAMLPKGEKIPVTGKGGVTEMVDAYLIETVAIDGASGSPVFARPTITSGPMTTDQGDEVRLSYPEAKAYLIGLYQGAWFAPPDQTRQQTVRAPDRVIVPVGVGIVVPAQKILELLDSDTLKAVRAQSTEGNALKTATD